MPISRTDHPSVPVMLRRELLLAGWHDRAISNMLRSKEWTRVRHGTYAVTKDWGVLDEAGQHLSRVHGVLRCARTEVAVSHASAALVHGAPTWGLPLDDVHITRRDGRIGRHEAGVHQHGGALSADDTIQVDGLTVTTPTRAALEVCTQTTVEAAMSTVSHLLRTGLTTTERIRERYERERGGMTQWPHSRTTDVVLRIANPLLESPGECRTFHLLWHAHLPAPELQHEVRDESGRVVARLDFAWPDLGVFLEFDGRVKYEKLLKEGERASDVVVREKRREELVCRLTGWRCIRITWADLENPERTLALVRAALLAARRARS